MSVREQLDRIESLRADYMDGKHRKLMPKQIKWWNKLLRGDSNGMSSGRKSVIKRAHTFVTAILKEIGAEVLLLVLSTMNNRTRLAEYPEKDRLLKALREWWIGVRHPPALKHAAECLAIDTSVVEVDNKEVDTITPKVEESGKSAPKLRIAFDRKNSYITSTRNIPPSTKYS
ncbi:hypothetical protein ACEQ8H_008978 [Pleosporales sp. CAS-2024a]